ncbi:MAG TPA: hypothetical protein VMY39_07840, partial [Planctomycetota bacterium]|nr:hypothetical protein [Planctomycetota bacterium]
PVSTVRAEVLREGLQEAEARVFVQNALLDEKSRTKLGAALAERAGKICRERTRALRYMSEFSTSGSGKGGWAVHFIFRPGPWQERSRELYDLAAEVANALKN